jgi:hypothetical protein
MFKKLTDQVKEVDEQLNSGRKNYSFKVWQHCGKREKKCAFREF